MYRNDIYTGEMEAWSEYIRDKLWNYERSGFINKALDKIGNLLDRETICMDEHSEINKWEEAINKDKGGPRIKWSWRNTFCDKSKSSIESIKPHYSYYLLINL